LTEFANQLLIQFRNFQTVASNFENCKPKEFKNKQLNAIKTYENISRSPSVLSPDVLLVSNSESSHDFSSRKHSGSDGGRADVGFANVVTALVSKAKEIARNERIQRFSRYSKRSGPVMDRDFSALTFRPRQRRLLPSIPPKRITFEAEPEKIAESPVEDAEYSEGQRAESENVNLVVGSPSTSLMAEILAPSPMFSPLLTPVHNSPHSEHSEFGNTESEHSESPNTADSVHLDLLVNSSAADFNRCRTNNSQQQFFDFEQNSNRWEPSEQTAVQKRLTSSATHCRRILPAIHKNSNKQLQVHKEIKLNLPCERREAFINNPDLPPFSSKRYPPKNEHPSNSDWADNNNYENYYSRNSRNFYVENRFHSDETDGPSEHFEMNEKFSWQSESELEQNLYSRSDSREINLTVSSGHEKPSERRSPEFEVHRLYQGNPNDFHSCNKNSDDSDDDEFI